MKKLIPTLGVAVILAAAASPAVAVLVTQNDDAFDLAAAFAPSPGGTVTGAFTEFSAGNMLGTFLGGNSTIGFEEGIVLSTGNASAIFFGATSPLSSAYSGSPSIPTQDLINTIPSLVSPGVPDFSDTVRLSLTVDPGLVSNFVNFSIGFLSSEVSESDRFGVFVNDSYTGILGGSAISLNHPWISNSISGIGFEKALYLDGNPLNLESFTVSIAVPSPGTTFSLDFILVDVFGDAVDTAVFLGGFSLTENAQGVLAIPEPSSMGLAALGAFLAWGLRRRRR